MREGFFLSHTITAVQACFALKKISVARFKSVPMVRYMSCFQLSDGLLFALVHLSASISPPARLPLAPLLPGENAQLMENIIYSCLSPNPRVCAMGKWGGEDGEKKEGFHALKAGGRGWQLKLVEIQLNKQATTHKTHSPPAMSVTSQTFPLWAAENMVFCAPICLADIEISSVFFFYLWVNK